MAYAKFQINRFKIDGEIAENHAILVNLVNLTASIAISRHCPNVVLMLYCRGRQRPSITHKALAALKYFCINLRNQRDFFSI